MTYGMDGWCNTSNTLKVLDCVSREAAIDVLSVGKELLSRVLDDIDVVDTDREKYSWGLGLIESYIKDIEELPPAQPEIVRCKDCKNWHTNCLPVCEKHGCDVISDYTKPDDFCSWAERRTDGI